MDSKAYDALRVDEFEKGSAKQCISVSDSDWAASVHARSSARWNAWMGQLRHRYRFLREHLRRPDVAILGSYHGANLGDIGLGITLRHLVRAGGMEAGLHTIHSAEKWPKCRYAIAGGGTISYRAALNNMTAVYGDCPERVAIIGVDFREPEAVREHSEFLSQVAHISCRSSAQADKMRLLLQRPDITWHFDACFAAPWFLPHGAPLPPSERRLPKVVGVNIPPLFIQYQGGRFVVGSAFEEEIKRKSPDVFAQMTKYAFSYVRFARELCTKLIRMGYQVVHIPFAVEDEFFSRTFLQQIGVHCDAFSGNPQRVIRRMARMNFFVPFRYHATVFALCARVPVYPFCYALKCEELLTDIGVKQELIVSPSFLLRKDGADEFLTLWGDGLILDERKLQDIQLGSETAINRIIGNLTNH